MKRGDKARIGEKPIYHRLYVGDLTYCGGVAYPGAIISDNDSPCRICERLWQKEQKEVK